MAVLGIIDIAASALTRKRSHFKGSSEPPHTLTTQI